MKKIKCYALKNTMADGIYFDWQECKPLIEGMPYASYRRFSSLEEAEKFLGLGKTHEVEQTVDFTTPMIPKRKKKPYKSIRPRIEYFHDEVKPVYANLEETKSFTIERKSDTVQNGYTVWYMKDGIERYAELNDDENYPSRVKKLFGHKIGDIVDNMKILRIE